MGEREREGLDEFSARLARFYFHVCCVRKIRYDRTVKKDWWKICGSWRLDEKKYIISRKKEEEKKKKMLN